MTQPLMTPFNPQTIVDAFGRCKRFPMGSPQFGIFSPYICHLAEIVGEDRLNLLVGFGNYCEVFTEYLRWLIANESFLESLGDREVVFLKEAYSLSVSQTEVFAANPAASLRALGITERDFMIDNLGLSEEAERRFFQGELTFAVLLTTCPEVFVPEHELR